MVFFGEPRQSYFPLDAIRNEQKFFELKGRKLFSGAEMFESGNQLVVNEYVKGLYTDDK
jgi:hypothetical protein